MTLPPVMRIFFAIDLPQTTKDKIGAFISQLKKKSKSHGVRWSRSENLHITLQFLPEVQTEHLEGLVEAVRKELGGIIHGSSHKFGQLHLFPNPFRPRVIVLDILPQESLSKLSALIGQGIVKANYPIESRPFRAHMSLGRIKQPQEMDLSFLTECVIPDLDLEVDEVVLFRSEPQSDGSKFSVLERIGLDKKALVG